MTKNLHEPSTPREVAANRYSGKLTQQRPYAYQWVTPVNVADCPADPYSLTDPRPAWTPCYLNDWERPTTLEPLSVRLSADGNLQWQGYVNSQNKTADIAFIMPGTLSGEPDMIPDISVGENLSYNVFVTPDDGTTINQGRAYVDSTTGEVTITTISGTPWARLGLGGATTTNNTWTRVEFTDAMSYNEETPGDIFTLTDAGAYMTITLSADGLYLVNGIFSWDDTFPEFRAVHLEQAIDDQNYSEGYGMTQTKGPFPSSGGPFFNIDWISSFVFVSSSVTNPTIDPRAYQSSGVNRGVEGYSVRVIYLGPIGAEAAWIFQSA